MERHKYEFYFKRLVLKCILPPMLSKQHFPWTGDLASTHDWNVVDRDVTVCIVYVLHACWLYVCHIPCLHQYIIEWRQ